MIEVVDYDPAWPGMFAALEARYRTALVDIPIIGIEHVGSTAVPGLAAKPVIDVDIIVTEADVGATCRALEALGLEGLGERGIPQRWAFRSPDGPIRTNTYVTIDGCLALRNHLGVRDVLRRDATLRDEYGELKKDLATQLDDIDEYVEAKSAVIQTILLRAGLVPDERNAIEQLNRRDTNSPE